MDKGMIRQIILVTDGHSNIGGNPVPAAKEAAEKGIIVNAIGIINPGSSGIEEVKAVAAAGEGEYQLVQIENLASSMVMVTLRSIQATLEQVVSRQLKELVGSEMKDIPPSERGKFVDMIERIQDEIDLKCLILLDTSGSMAGKLETAKESVLSLFKSLEVRKGRNIIGIMAFPGSGGSASAVISPFTDNIRALEKELSRLKAAGGTPTSLALRDAAAYLMGEQTKERALLEEQIV
jgi:Ca-activated chloride channel family protein